MSNCIFCNAKAKEGWSDERSVQWFECGTMYQTGEGNRFDQTSRCADVEREKLNVRIERLKSAGDAILEFYKNRRHNEFFTFVAGVQKIEADWTAAKEEQP